MEGFTLPPDHVDAMVLTFINIIPTSRTIAMVIVSLPNSIMKYYSKPGFIHLPQLSDDHGSQPAVAVLTVAVRP